jgi:acyl-CoA synthetase (AMP-forming)/AMP-acid ligase II
VKDEMTGAVRSPCHFLEYAVAGQGAQPAVVTDGVTITYDELGRCAHRVARVLAELPPRNPRVALLTENGPAYVVLYWATLLAGRTTVELNPALADPELGSCIRTTDPFLVLAGRDHAARLERLSHDLASGRAVTVASRRGSDLPVSFAERLNDALEARATDAPSFQPVPVTSTATASIVYTSGTTGRVKGVCLSHENLAAVTEAIAASFELEGRDGSERLAGNLPLYYTYGKSVLLLATYLGAPIIFTRRLLSPQTLVRLIEAEGITHLSTVPYLCNLLLTRSTFSAAQLPTLRRVTIAGGALQPAGFQEMLRRFPGRVIPMYGLTEASTRVTSMPPGGAAQHAGSCGKPLPGVDVAILGEDGGALPAGAVGEIAVRGPNVMSEYFRDREATEEALVGGWLRTGDLGVVDEDGYLTIAGRRKDIIKVLGESVSALSLELAIAELTGVAEVAVIGTPDEKMGEAICAVVVRHSGSAVDARVVRRHCAETFGGSRVPSRIVFRDELPKSSSGKVRKDLLARSISGSG